MVRPRCALVVGHTPRAPGATSAGGVSEFPFEQGAAAARYTTPAHGCTASGNGGTWVPMRAPTGN